MQSHYNSQTDPVRSSLVVADKLMEYADCVLYSDAQLAVLRRGIMDGVDVTPIANPDLPLELMIQFLEHSYGEKEYIIRCKGDNSKHKVRAYTKKLALDNFLEDCDASQVIDVTWVGDINAEDETKS